MATPGTKITVDCPSCSRTLSVSEEHAGKKVRCPGCKNPVQLPAAAAAASSGRPRPASARPPAARRRSPDSARPRSRQRAAGKAVSNPDDIWNQPLSSYSSPAIPEEEYETYGIERPTRSYDAAGNPYAAGRAGRDSGPREETYTPVIIFAGVCALIGLVGIGLNFVSLDVGRMVCIVSLAGLSLVSAYQQWRIIGHAYEESFVTGFLCWSVGPYFLYFLLTRWHINKGPFLKSLVCTVAMIVPVIGLFAPAFMK